MAVRSFRRVAPLVPVKASDPIRPTLKSGSKRLPRRGYAMAIGVFIRLRREGRDINMKRVDRLYKAMGLQLRNKTSKRRVKARRRDDRQDATMFDEVWAMDFVHGQLATGRTLPILTIVDTWSRYSPGIDPRFSDTSEDVVQTLERICARSGYRQMIRVDPRSEFNRVIWTSGLTRTVLRQTSRARANQLIMPLLSLSKAHSGLNV